MLLDFENLELRAAIIDLRAHLATAKLERALHAYGDYLEGKYSPDQPRAPQGTPDGGQWIVDGGSARQHRLRERHLVAQTTPSGFVDPRTFQPANEDNSLLGQMRARSVEAAARLLDFVVQRQQEDPQGLEDVLKLTQLLDPSDMILDLMLSAEDKGSISDLVQNAAERLKPYLDDIATKLESGEVNDETALLLTTGAIIAVAKYAPKLAKTRAFAQIRPTLRRIVSRLGASRQIVKPKVTNAKLGNFVDNVYKGVSNPQHIGDGTLGAAVRYEIRTGKPVQGLRHQIKARETIRGLRRWLVRNPNATINDRKIASDMISDLENALRGQ